VEMLFGVKNRADGGSRIVDGGCRNHIRYPISVIRHPKSLIMLGGFEGR